MKNNIILGIFVSVAAMAIYDILKRDVVAAARAVNPADSDNVINRWFDDVYSTATGSAQSLGADIYDWIHDTGGEK